MQTLANLACEIRFASTHELGTACGEGLVSYRLPEFWGDGDAMLLASIKSRPQPIHCVLRLFARQVLDGRRRAAPSTDTLGQVCLLLLAITTLGSLVFSNQDGSTQKRKKKASKHREETQNPRQVKEKTLEKA